MRLMPLLTFTLAPSSLLAWYALNALAADSPQTFSPESHEAISAIGADLLEALQPVNSVQLQLQIGKLHLPEAHTPSFSASASGTSSASQAPSQPTVPLPRQATGRSVPIPPRAIDANLVRAVVSRSTGNLSPALAAALPQPAFSAAVAPAPAASTPVASAIVASETTAPARAHNLPTGTSERSIAAAGPATVPARTGGGSVDRTSVLVARANASRSTKATADKDSNDLLPPTLVNARTSIAAAPVRTAAVPPANRPALVAQSRPPATPGAADATAPLPTNNAEEAPATDSSSPPSDGSRSIGVSENYLLGPGDIIQVGFFNVPEYSGQHRISTDGFINLPLVGRVAVQGMTLGQASDAIAARYASELRSPIVSIDVVQQRPVQIAIAGEIQQPGLYSIPVQGTDYPRLFQVLQQAGGLTQAADLKQVEVRRWGLNGTQSVVKVDLLALLQHGDISQNIFLQDGDSIMIPSATDVDRAALNQLSVSNLRANANQPIDIAIVGEINQPGPYQLGGGGTQVTAIQALQEAGGITPSANLREIQLRRQTRQGGEQVFNINLWEALQVGDLSQDIVLQQGDTLVVPTATDNAIADITTIASSSLSTGTIQVNVIGEVESPGALQVRANTSFNQALLAAGGFNNRANPEATLVRFNPNGTVSRQNIEVDLSQDINAETNPVLRPNDVIVVGRSAKAALDDELSGFSRTFNLVWPFLLLF